MTFNINKVKQVENERLHQYIHNRRGINTSVQWYVLKPSGPNLILAHPLPKV